MSNSTTEQELNWPLLEQFIDQPLNKIPEEYWALIASVLPASWDALLPAQRESLIKASDCPTDPSAEVKFAAAFHGFDTLAKMPGITATEAAEALLTERDLLTSGCNVDSLARTLSTNEELNAGKDVFHPLAEWLRRAREKGIAYLPSLDWAVERYSVPSAPVATPSGVPEKPVKRRFNQTRAILESFIAVKVPPNIESIWLHIRSNSGKAGFPFKTSSPNTATHIDGEVFYKFKMERSLHSLLKTNCG